MDLRKIGLEGVDWIQLVQDRNRWRALVNTVMNLQVPQKTRNFLTRRACAIRIKKLTCCMELVKIGGTYSYHCDLNG
jgi:hypothetical protein